MGKSKIVAAIDIGSSEIKTLVAQVSYDNVTFERSINIVGVATSNSQGVKKGQIVDIEDAVESTILSVEAAERMAGYNLERAYLLVNGGHVECRNSKGVVAVSDPGGEINDTDVTRVIAAARAISLPASREIIHVLPREFIVDGEGGVKDPIGMTGVRLEVDTHIVTASAPALKNLTRAVSEVGVEVEGIVFAGYASAYSTLSSTEKELGCVVVDIGSGITSVAAFVDGALTYSGAIPIGARNVTNDLAIGLRVSLETAEKIKLGLGERGTEKRESSSRETIEIAETGSRETKKVAKRTLTEGIIRPRMSEIFSMVKIELERSGIVNRIPAGVIVTGGGALTVGTADIAKRVLGLPVRVGVPSGVSGLIDDIGDPRFSASVGLILHAASSDDLSREEISFSIPKKLKLPDKIPFSRLFETIRNLLP